MGGGGSGLNRHQESSPFVFCSKTTLLGIESIATRRRPTSMRFEVLGVVGGGVDASRADDFR